MNSAVPFDVFASPLEGINLIEASAGTGKTWNICGLYLRLLVERRLEVRDILVVTFTNAATAELRERVRRRIRETLDYLCARGPESNDPFVSSLVTSFETAGIDREDITLPLELALQTFDEASIFTIHGFCQRALADTPFTAAEPFEMELLPDDRDMHLDVARDFWRRHVAGGECVPALAGYLARRNDTPEGFAEFLRRRSGKPLARLVWPDGIDHAAQLDTRALEGFFDAARATWQASREDIVQALRGARPGLHQNSYKPHALEKAFLDWDAYFAAGDPLADLAADGLKLDLCRASRLKACTRKREITPTHVFCDSADALFAARDTLDASLALARLRLIRTLLEEGVETLRQRKRDQRVLGYDDILLNLHEALHQARDGAALAASLRARFPAALIDEFQDTDPVQFGIFRTIYGTGPAPLFLVGDPKQAIYSFRNADLHTYLQARQLARAEHTLDENQRSTGDLIAAMNALFGANPRAFVLSNLDYHDVRQGAKPRKVLRDDTPVPRADCCVWTLPQDAAGTFIERKAAMQAVEMATAGEIARLLRGARSGGVALDDRPLEPRDVAVLVRSHAQGARVREQLRMLGIGSVELSQASVFTSPDAEEVERVLLAVLNPAHTGYLKSALATELLGHDAAAVSAVAADESALMPFVARFDAYRDLWVRRGVGIMYRRLLSAEGVSARMLARPDGERRLTNLLHIGERLHEAAELHRAPDTLLRWLHEQRRDEHADEVAQLRLESDRHLVNIVTIHKAKGLEYPVVFCPYVWDGHASPSNDWPGACTYHDRAGTAVVDFRDEAQRGDDAAWIKTQVRLEGMAENVRLLYVALTRASHRCYMVAGCYSTNGKAPSTKESTRSTLNWLVGGAGTAPETWCESSSPPAEIMRAWWNLAAACPGRLTVAPIPRDRPTALRDDRPSPESLRALDPPAHVLPAWRISSYSGLSFEVDTEYAAIDHDMRAAQRASGRAPVDLAPDDILAFPRGAMAGECLHAVLERIDFGDESTWPGAVRQTLTSSSFDGRRADPERLGAMVQRMLRDVLATQLPDGICLAKVPKSRRLTELEFNLPSPHLSAHALNAMLSAHGYRVPRLTFAQLEGYLKGFIDLVFEHGGRFYILDWKSNHLGYGSADYGAASLEQAMVEHGYHLQHLLYSLALHRYLTRRLAKYRFATHFGGVLYLFVRGVRPAWKMPDGHPAGVYFHHLQAEALADLERLFPHSHEAMTS